MKLGSEVFISTTSFKTENLDEVLCLYSDLNWNKLDLNLHPFLFESDKFKIYLDIIREKNFKIGFLSGGWCDFFVDESKWTEIHHNLIRQAQIALQLECPRIRLFLGRLELEKLNEELLSLAIQRVSSLAQNFPNITFSYENHDGVSLNPDILLRIVSEVNLPTVRLTFDPVNFERAGVDSIAAYRKIKDFVCHVHVKGLAQGKEYCEYGAGDFDYNRTLDEVISSGYKGNFTLEYEGHHNAVVKLHKSYYSLRSKLLKLIP